MSSGPKALELPDLKSYLGKKIMIRLRSGRRVSGVLDGYDEHMNLVIEDGAEETGKPEESTKKADIGQVFIRGNMIINLEKIEA